MHALIVDDEWLVRWFMERALRKWGHSVVSVDSIRSAQTELKKRKFDAVFIDLKFPEGNGMTLIHDLLGDMYLPQRLIVCSAYISVDSEKEMETMGINVLRKPFHINELEKALSRVNGTGSFLSALADQSCTLPLRSA